MAESQIERLERDFPPEKRAELYDKANPGQRKVVDRLHMNIATAESDEDKQTRYGYLHEYLEALSDPFQAAVLAGEEGEKKELDELPMDLDILFRRLGIKGTGDRGKIRPVDVDIAAAEGRISSQMYEIFLQEMPSELLVIRDMQIPLFKPMALEDSPGVKGQTIPVDQSVSEKLQQINREAAEFEKIRDQDFLDSVDKVEQVMPGPYNRKPRFEYLLPSGRSMPIGEALRRGFLEESDIVPGGSVPPLDPRIGPKRRRRQPDSPPEMETSFPAELLRYTTQDLLELERQESERDRRK